MPTLNRPSNSPSKSPSANVLILAAGQGKRMKSKLPKVLHELAGAPMIIHTLRAISAVLPSARVGIVIGHGGELVRERLREAEREIPQLGGLKIDYIEQTQQLGTGHAALCAVESAWGKLCEQEDLNVLVLPGDLPLLTQDLIAQMSLALRPGEALRLLTTILQDPKGYGRAIRKSKSGPVTRIVEEKDASLREKAVREVAASIYLFRWKFMKTETARLSNKNAQKEYYLTDLIAAAAKTRKKIDTLIWPVAEDLRGVNDPWELAEARKMLNTRLVRKHALNGVRFIDPASTWLDAEVEIGEDVTIHPGVLLRGGTRIAAGAQIGAYSVLTDVQIGEGAEIRTGVVADTSEVGAKAAVGPYVHLRPESSVGAKSKLGNFVELKKASIGENTSISHLSYLGDAEVGARVNIGCGFITCNFDGRVIEGQRKHRTVIEDDVFMGSDCQTIAPVRIGKGAYIASGSTITDNVEPEALAIARSRQVTKPGYAKKLKGN